MTPALPSPTELAKQLLAAEFEGDAAAALRRVYEKIHAELAPIVGRRGVSALLDRSIKLSAREHEALRSVPLDGAADTRNTERLEQRLNALEADVALQLAVVVVASLLALIMRFIGEQLVMQLLQKAFPETVAPGITKQ